uniref:Uncharacterized protein n=1 Tax=Fagus sylvatica TaxID=28930 RepID=A0A2N9EHF8_FAGSY
MVCFLACFGTCKRPQHRKLACLTPSTHQSTHGISIEPSQPTEPLKQEDIEEPINLISESNPRKKVTFDLNVKTNEKQCTKEVINTLVESNETKESEKKEEKAKESKSFSDLIREESSESLFSLSYPTNHRYQNCADCEDEFEDIDLVESEFADVEGDVGGDNQTFVQEESSGSLFSLSIDSRKYVRAIEIGEKEVNSPMPLVHTSPDKELKTIGLNPNAGERSQYVHSVLNPIENLTQLKAVQAKTTTPSKNQAKENINLEPHFNIAASPEPCFKQLNCNLRSKSNDLKLAEQEIAVDTSLSSWPILGALTIEELRKCSASTSPRRARSQSPDDTPIIGTVGSYWTHTGQSMNPGSGSSGRGFTNTGSKKIEDEKMKWNSTPFEARLERVMERGTAEL